MCVFVRHIYERRTAPRTPPAPDTRLQLYASTPFRQTTYENIPTHNRTPKAYGTGRSPLSEPERNARQFSFASLLGVERLEALDELARSAELGAEGDERRHLDPVEARRVRRAIASVFPAPL